MSDGPPIRSAVYLIEIVWSFEGLVLNVYLVQSGFDEVVWNPVPNSSDYGVLNTGSTP